MSAVSGTSVQIPPETEIVSITLTHYENKVYSWLVEGMSNHAISVLIMCSEKTVKHHTTLILRKAHCKSRAELIVAHYKGYLKVVIQS